MLQITKLIKHSSQTLRLIIHKFRIRHRIKHRINQIVLIRLKVTIKHKIQLKTKLII